MGCHVTRSHGFGARAMRKNFGQAAVQTRAIFGAGESATKRSSHNDGNQDESGDGPRRWKLGWVHSRVRLMVRARVTLHTWTCRTSQDRLFSIGTDYRQQSTSKKKQNTAAVVTLTLPHHPQPAFFYFSVHSLLAIRVICGTKKHSYICTLM